MDHRELRDIAQVMKDFGIASYKAHGVELVMSLSDSKVSEVATPKEEVPTLESNPPESLNDPIKHQVEQLTNLMKLNDSDLVDSLFPDHTQDEAAS